jgi:hypothetical protein
MVGEPAETSQSLDEELRQDALDVLRDVTRWTLSDSRWTSVADVVGALAAALAARDWTSLRAAVYDLELAGPVRATRIGTTTILVPAPEPVREEINELIHALADEKP